MNLVDRTDTDELDAGYHLLYTRDGTLNHKQVWAEDDIPQNARRFTIHRVSTTDEGVGVYINYHYDHRLKDGYDERVSERSVFVPDAQRVQLVRSNGDVVAVTDTVTTNDSIDAEDLPDDPDALHDRLMEVGREVEPESEGVDNKLTDMQLKTILQTMQFFGVDKRLVVQSKRDLSDPYRYRVFDWLGMMLQQGKLDDEQGYEKRQWLITKFAKLYIQKRSVDGFVQELRSRDLAVDYRREN